MRGCSVHGEVNGAFADNGLGTGPENVNDVDWLVWEAPPNPSRYGTAVSELEIAVLIGGDPFCVSICFSSSLILVRNDST